MTYSLEKWARIHLVTARDLHARWEKERDPLMEEERFDETRATPLWTVKSELELVRLIGALNWMNPDYTLWFRGEQEYFEKALPRRARVDNHEDTKLGIAWLDEHAYRDRALRDRRPLARAAILQHYGCPTSLLDVSASYEVACAFAFASAVANQSHLRVYALPRHRRPVTVFDNADVVLVDLRAELPSYCMRPHAQQAAFIARREAVYNDIAKESRVPREDAKLDPLCIVHVKLAFEGKSRFYEPRAKSLALYPKASSGCAVCKKRDMNGDYLRHLLECIKNDCIKRKELKGVLEGFPDNF